MSTCPHIRTGVDDGVALIEIARPDKKNALTGEMYVAMAQALQAAQAEPAVRAMLISSRASSPRATTSRTS
jgi:enoyl-CoA hydratase/carnithine racemase